MTATLEVEQAGPLVTIQDLGRPGYMAVGLSQGGAADRFALAEGAALLDQPLRMAALEMAGLGGRFRATADMRIALTGAPMVAAIDGQPVSWNASHQLRVGQRLAIGATLEGIYGYLHVGGGIDAPEFLDSRSAHLLAGIGKPVVAGDVLPIGIDPKPHHCGMLLDVAGRFGGGAIRLLPGVHTDKFSPETRARFAATVFSKTQRANRQAAELAFEGEPFGFGAHLNILSEPMVPGDIQMTGEGRPYALLPECQTTGGFPRIGVIMPDDFPTVAQAGPGTKLTFKFASHAEALAQHVPLATYEATLRQSVRPLVRSPSEIADLLSYQLISGAVSGTEED